jgi:hemophore-related protein
MEEVQKVFTPSLTRLAAATGGLALSLTAAAGIASASPDLGAAINTTCTYPQAVSALNAQNPAAAADFNASPVAQSWLSSFLASPPDQRQQMADELQGSPQMQQYAETVSQVANTCDNY